MILSRETDIGYLDEFVSKKGSGLIFVRGRRRVGKSWLLKEFANKHRRQRIFCFSGRLDERTKRGALKRMVMEWEAFSNKSNISCLRSELIDWKNIFDDMHRYALEQSTALVIIFDEIQWISSSQSGFIGALKEAWIDWEHCGRIKVIVCGSSQRFFSQMTGGEERILRGIVTSGDLWVEPFSVSMIHRHWFPKWKPQEVLLCQMMTGGIPYYLQQIDQSSSFIHAINDTFFCRDTIFFREAQELLQLDFNENGCRSATDLMSVLGEGGATEAQIVERSGMARQTVSDMLKKLKRYMLIDEVLPISRQAKVKTQREVKYALSDSFLDFFFKVIAPRRESILANRKGLLFARILESKNSYYISGYTGTAFERLVRRRILEFSKSPGGIHKTLGLRDFQFTAKPMWTPPNGQMQSSQIDIVVSSQSDRILRIIECKWSNKQSVDHINQVLAKNIKLLPHQERQNFLCVAYEPTHEFIRQANAKDVRVIQLADLL